MNYLKPKQYLYALGVYFLKYVKKEERQRKGGREGEEKQKRKKRKRTQEMVSNCYGKVQVNLPNCRNRKIPACV